MKSTLVRAALLLAIASICALTWMQGCSRSVRSSTSATPNTNAQAPWPVLAFNRGQAPPVDSVDETWIIAQDVDRSATRFEIRNPDSSAWAAFHAIRTDPEVMDVWRLQVDGAHADPAGISDSRWMQLRGLDESERTFSGWVETPDSVLVESREPGFPPSRLDRTTAVQMFFDLMDRLERLTPEERDRLDRLSRALGHAEPDPSVAATCGGMVTVVDKRSVPVPLKHTKVDASVAAFVGTVNVTQQFHNPYDTKIEAVYVFPLPQDAGVTDFVMTVGDRKIRGIVREREEAERIYRQARAQGHVASLMSQERPNIFTQKVANIERGKAIDVDITYFHTLRYEDGWMEWVFPMVVGPRYNPSSTTDGIGAVPRGGVANGQGAQPTNVEYLAPTERSGHDVSLSVRIDAGCEVEDVESVNHTIVFDGETGERSTWNHVGREARETGRFGVALSPLDSIPNKDFVLRWKVSGDDVRTALVLTPDADRGGGGSGVGGHFAMMLVPPAELGEVPRRPLELVFVLDCSGSMSGEPLRQSKDAAIRALLRMQPDDTFQVIRFSNNSSALGAAPLRATKRNVSRGIDYIESLRGQGGTEMIEGIKASLEFPGDAERLRYVVFMTDGYIGNEEQILAAMRPRLGSARVFGFGVGSSPNRSLIHRMSTLGRGTSAFLSLEQSGAEVMDTFLDAIASAPLTDIEIVWGGLDVSDLYAGSGGLQGGVLPDLFAERPIMVSGRYEGVVSDGGDGPRIRVTGLQGSAPVAFDVAAGVGEHAGVRTIWARRKIASLMSRFTAPGWDREEVEQDITRVALTHRLVSGFTSFVAVDSMEVTDGEFGVTVPVPVNVPDGVRYETTVGETGGGGD